MDTEIELKLLTEPASLRRLRRLPWLRSMQRGRAEARALRSTYFDTDDLRLRANKVALRVRAIGRRRILTLKTAGLPAGGAFARGEWQRPVADDRPDPAVLAASPAAALFDAATVAALRPVLRTEVRRSELRLNSGPDEMLLAFDEGRIVAGDTTAPLCEIEIELVHGSPRALFDLALRLHQQVPLRLGHASKAERGFRLLNGAVPAARRWSAPDLAAGMTAAEAVQHIGRSCIDQLAANSECLTAGGDTEAVHQCRVALRRLRSAIALFAELLVTPETAAVEDGLRWLLAQLAPGRDIDVVMAEIVQPVAEALPDDQGLAALQARLAARRDEHYRSALAALHAPRFTTLMLTLGAWIEGGDWLSGGDALGEPVEALAGRRLERRDRKLRRRGLRHLATLPPAERHALRIQVKKLRYAADFLAPLYPAKRGRRSIAGLAELQQRLGVLNDVAVAAALLAELASDGPAGLQRAAGLVEGWHAGRQRRRLARAEAAAAKWLDLPRFWRAA